MAMKFHRRKFLHLAGAAVLLSQATRSARAQSYPTRPVHLIVAYPAGSAPDTIARLTAQHLSTRLGQPFIVENRPGAASNIGTEYVAKAQPDGYTILMPVSTNTVNAALYRNLNFDFLRDIAPIASIARTAFVITVPMTFPPKTLSEFITYLKDNPGKINMGSAGIGGVQHVSGELFQLMTGTKMLHVPYRSDFMPDLLAGHVQVVWVPVAQALPLVRDGKLRALAVTTTKRAPALPDVPTINEVIKGYESSGWYGIGAPAKTPSEVTSKLAVAMSETLADPTVKERLLQLGFDPMPMTTEEFAKHVADEVAKWSNVIKAQGIQVN
jgi:tripartite-type tricarboxylate transporter receptor subunit TctC